MDNQEDLGDVNESKPQINERVKLREWAEHVLSKRYHEALHHIARMIINVLDEDKHSLFTEEELKRIAHTGDFVKRIHNDDVVVLD